MKTVHSFDEAKMELASRETPEHLASQLGRKLAAESIRRAVDRWERPLSRKGIASFVAQRRGAALLAQQPEITVARFFAI